MNYWDKTTPVSTPIETSSFSHRGFFWIGWAVGFVNALLLVAALMLLRTFLA